MADYIGNKCPVCSNEFVQEDEIVVCPFCGTPHHRACYSSNGRCVNEHFHAEGFEWVSESENEPPVRCANCGAENFPNAQLCSNCRTVLHRETEADSTEESADKDWLGAGRGFTGVYSIGASASALLDNERLDGVPIGDVRKYVGRAAEYYAPVFYTLKKLGRSVSMNFAALLGHGIWFLSRRMYLRGIIMLVVMLASYAVRAVTMVAVPELAETTLFANPELMSRNLPLMIAYVVANLLQYTVITVSGLLGNKIYMKTCLRRIKRINASSKNANEFNSKLARKGSICLPAMTIGATIYIAGVYTVTYHAQTILAFAQKIVDYFV